MNGDEELTIGALAKRTGVAVSAIRFYEEKGLIASERTAGNQRRFRRSDIRRISFVLIAQELGLNLGEIERALRALPKGRSPTVADWQKLSRSIRAQLDEKIGLLTKTRTKLDQCIGCGCLSLSRCQQLNPQDRAGKAGTGPRYVLG